MPVADPILNPRAWDTVVVAGQQNPGWCVVGKFKRKNGWDEKKLKGGKGATLSLVNFPLVTGTIEFHLLSGQKFGAPPGVYWTHLNDWLTYSELFQYDPTKTAPKAVQIFHPSFVFLKVNNFVCEDISNPVKIEIGHYVVEVSLKEWAPAPPQDVSATALSTQAKSPKGPNGPPGTPPDPAIVALQKQKAADHAQLTSLAGIPANQP